MLWSLPLLPALAALVLPLAGGSRFYLGAIACGGTALTFILALFAGASGWTSQLEWSEALSLQLSLTPLSATVAALVPLIASAILCWAAAHEDEGGLTRLLALLLLFAGGMELLVAADDLLTLLIGWEIVGACSWALIGHEWREIENPSSGRYAFVTTRLGDLGLFIAAIAAFAGTGSFSYSALSGLASPYIEIVAFGILIAAASKSGQVPFSPWLFRAMAGPSSVSALLHAATMVAAGAYILIRLHPALQTATGFSEAVMTVGLVTALAGGLVALVQDHAKKLLAASTSAQYGLMFVAVGAGYPGVALLHLVAHAGFKALLFLAAGTVSSHAETFDLHEMGSGKSLRTAAWLSGAGALALAGVPPLGGGWTKEMVVTAAGHASIWLAIGVMFSGALTAAYAARFQLLSFAPETASGQGGGAGRGELAGMSVLAALTIALSALWLPPVYQMFAKLLSVHFPSLRPIETAASLSLMAGGLFAGWLLARRHLDRRVFNGGEFVAAWLGLPAAIDLWVVRPAVWLAHASSRFDDRWIDAGLFAISGAVRSLSGAFTRGDRRLVDRGVLLAADLTTALARLSAVAGEKMADEIPEGSGRFTGFGGKYAQQLQTGLSHHYYAIIACGGALLFTILLIGS